jgi:hypothetical protein
VGKGVDVSKLFKVVGRLGSIAAIGAAVVFVLPIQAGADGGYPGTTTTTTGSAVPQNITLTIGVGGSQTATLCGFAPLSSISLGINGTSDGTASADSNGCVTVTYIVTDPHISANGGPAVTAAFGSNVSTVSGESSSGLSLTDDVTIIIPASAVTPAGSGLAFTGADIAAMVVGGLLLIGLGGVLIMVARRRGMRHSI